MFNLPYRWLVWLILLCGCAEPNRPSLSTTQAPSSEPVLVVLGIAQDAGFPQAGCEKSCCKAVWNQPEQRKMVSCLGLADPATNRYWLFDATPDIRFQMRMMEQAGYGTLAGIFLTHAHMGHYTGLLYLGRESMGADRIPVYAYPRMRQFLENNGPWSQLVELNNIALHDLSDSIATQLTNEVLVRSFLVPHRDEFSETAGFSIEGPQNKALFIPDIDKWNRWDTPITAMIQDHDLAFLDGTFFKNGELPGRDMGEIPHPFVEESMALFGNLPLEDRNKVHFIHFNHTNPLLHENALERQQLNNSGLNAVWEGDQFNL